MQGIYQGTIQVRVSAEVLIPFLQEMRRDLKTRSKVQTQAVRDMLDALPSLTGAPMEDTAANVPRDTISIITQSLWILAKHGRRVPSSKVSQQHVDFTLAY
jgi:hypothetical protein